MGRSVTEFSEFNRETAGETYPRYKINYGDQIIRDTKFSRNISASKKRGGEPHYRLVDNSGVATHVLASDIFGAGAIDYEVESDFEPQYFSDRYDFDVSVSPPRVVCRGGTPGSVKGQVMRLLSPNGWDHWALRNNEGRRVCVTPAEVVQAFNREEWEVDPPEGSKTVAPLFTNYAFTKDGLVFRVKSKEVLVRPEPVPVRRVPDPWSKNPDQDTIYRLYSDKGQRPHYDVTRATIKGLFTSDQAT